MHTDRTLSRRFAHRPFRPARGRGRLGRLRAERPCLTTSSSSCPRAAAATFPPGRPCSPRRGCSASTSTSVCGGRGICSRCQVEPGLGDFPKLGLDVAEALALALERGRGALRPHPRPAHRPPPRLPGADPRRRGDRRARDQPGPPPGGAQGGRRDARGHGSRPPASSTSRWPRRGSTTPPAISSGCAPRLPSNGRSSTSPPASTPSPASASRSSASPTVTLALQRRLILDAWPGYRDGPLMGLAIDVGSTTVAAHLCALDDGRILASGGPDEPADPLRRGPDVARKLRHDERGRRRAHDARRSAPPCTELATELAAEAKADPELWSRRCSSATR